MRKKERAPVLRVAPEPFQQGLTTSCIYNFLRLVASQIDPHGFGFPTTKSRKLYIQVRAFCVAASRDVGGAMVP